MLRLSSIIAHSNILVAVTLPSRLSSRGSPRFSKKVSVLVLPLPSRHCSNHRVAALLSLYLSSHVSPLQPRGAVVSLHLHRRRNTRLDEALNMFRLLRVATDFSALPGAAAGFTLALLMFSLSSAGEARRARADHRAGRVAATASRASFRSSASAPSVATASSSFAAAVASSSSAALPSSVF